MAQKKHLSDEEIIELWKDPSFTGSFSGVANFARALELEKNVTISRRRLFEILRKDEDFLLETRKIRKHFPRRSMNLHGYGKLFQSDVAFMMPVNNYIGFLLCIDIFSRKIFCELLQSKRAEDIRQAFNNIFKEAKVIPEKLETDQGTEFRGNKAYFLKNGIFFKEKFGKNKASFAEHSILLVKTKLFRIMRTHLTDTWPSFLKIVVQNINNLPNIAIGGLKPAEIETPEDTPLIDKALGYKSDVTYEQQILNQSNYEKRTDLLQVGQCVFIDFPPTVLEKSYDTKNHQLFYIGRIDAGKTPPLYKLKDLQGAWHPGYFYREQLIKAQRPKPGHFFKVSDILDSKIKNGKEYVLVHFLHYPSKFDKWILKSNMTGSTL